MLVEEKKTGIYNVSDITQDQKQRILDFLHGMVYAQCANAPDEWFSVRSFLGADNFDWGDTPLQVLYEKHISSGKNPDDAIDSAGKDAGKLLKKAIDMSNREFETKKEDLIRKYKWIRQNL
jgi:hypothetical protein